MRRVSVSNLLTPFASGLRPVVAQHRALSAPITDLLVVAVCATYALQAFGTALWNAPSVLATTNYLYLREPWLAWPLAPLLHGGLSHVVPNVLTLLAFGRVVEDALPTRRFAAMVVASAAGSIAALAVWSLRFGAEPNVAVYGISGVVFAAGGFAVAYVTRHRRATELELLAALFGGCAVALVAAELLAAAVLGAPAVPNVGHAVGVLVGVAVAVRTPLREGARDGPGTMAPPR